MNLQPQTEAQPGAVRFALLLATYNGEKYLEEQLDSAERQDVQHVDVLVSDDGSSDGTLALLEAWRDKWGKGSFSIVKGPRKGFAENFRHLTLEAPAGADYYAFCDQDDLWDRDKLSIAAAALAGPGNDRPAAYFSRTRLVDAGGETFGYSPLFRRLPGFGNAIVQSIGGGNTLVLNGAAFEIFRESARRTPFVTHDWWCYLIICGVGGSVTYDPVAHIGYRQHGQNVMGDNMGLTARIFRLRELMRGRFAEWSELNVAGLERCNDMLTAESKALLDDFRRIRGSRSLLGLWRSGIGRQTWPGNVALYVATLFGKL